MEFKTLLSNAEEAVIKGNWKPLFKYRFNEDYFDTNKRIEYETELRNKIFGNNRCDIVITKNSYPFNYGKDIEQYVIWIKNNDPGIIEIAKLIEKIYSGFDYIVAVNKIQTKSIKTIQHYHTVLKIPSVPSHLTKLVVFCRHANRTPIIKFPVIEKIFGNTDMSHNPNANLLDIGRTNSIKFGNDLKNIYNLQNDFVKNSFFMSSPLLRCQETVKNIITGLGLPNEHISIVEKLKMLIPEKINQMVSEICPFEKYQKLYEKICKSFGLSNCSKAKYRPLDLYDYYCSVQCYRDMNIDMRKFIDEQTENELALVAQEIYNVISCYSHVFYKDTIKELISVVMDMEYNLIVCSTHDTLIFTLTKFFAETNGTDHNFELPHYLSNVRIEQWSDGTIRLYYGNCYLGDNLI